MKDLPSDLVRVFTGSRILSDAFAGHGWVALAQHLLLEPLDLQHEWQLVLCASQTLHHQLGLALAEFSTGGRFDYLQARFGFGEMVVRLLEQVFQLIVVFRQVRLQGLGFGSAEGACSIEAAFHAKEFSL